MNTCPSCMEFISEPESDFGGLGPGSTGVIDTRGPLRMRDRKKDPVRANLQGEIWILAGLRRPGYSGCTGDQ